MKTWHVVSGGGRCQCPVNAETVEGAYIEALRMLPLDSFGKLIAAYEDGAEFNGPMTTWGLTEWYLERAGYEEIEPHLWKKKRDQRESSSGKDGASQQMGKNVATRQPSAPAPTLKTDSTEPLTRDTPPHRNRPPKRPRPSRKTGERERTAPQLKQVTIERTPEEWAAIVSEAKWKSTI